MASKLFRKKKINSKPKQENTPETVHTYSTLSEVMDRTRDIAFFYSGVEYGRYLDGCYNMGIRDFLMSYHYLRSVGLKDIFVKYPDIKLFIDSGAFTYMEDSKYEDYTIEQWEEHIKGYLKWAEKHKEFIFAIANFDIEKLVGGAVVMKWNRELFEPFMLRTGIPVCFVYHDGTSETTWEKYCERYPYVGFSTASGEGNALDMNDFREYLRVAEKHDTLVHGFGMTRIKELSELPYYTVDSTTWKVGMRYGKLIIFDGKSVKQIDKKDWDSKALPLIQNYPINIDIDLLWEYDEPEVIRANVYAFILAENYVKESIKHLQYWKKAKAVVQNLNSLPPDFFPSVEWLESNKKNPEDVKLYAKKMNINPNKDNIDEVSLTIIDMTYFINWNNSEYEVGHRHYLGEHLNVLNDLHDKYLNHIVNSDEEKIQELIQFYTECLCGQRDTLLQEGTNFDRIVKERESYFDDTEYEEVDIDRNSILAKLGKYLPESEDGMPEVDELDDEIFNNIGVKPVRDEKGRLVKGHVNITKPRKIYSKMFPKLACDTCNAAAKCPNYKSGYVCAYNKIFTGFDTRNAEDVITAMQGMANHNITRMQKAMVMETINGTIDPDVTSLIDQNMRILNNLNNLYSAQNTTVLRQTRTAQADGTVTETMSVTNPQSGGILEQLFKKSQSKPDKEVKKKEDVIEIKEDVIDVTEVVETDFND